MKRFGVVDKQHTWNIAERGNINVTVDRPSRILVSGIIGGKRYLLGDYAGVEGSRALNFDMPVGCTELRVTDGREEIYTKAGLCIRFANKGRVIHEYPDHDVVKVTRTDYRELSDETIRSFGRYLPEKVLNVGKVTQNFTFVANGSFTIYPVFWQTSSYNTLGIYYESDEPDVDGKPKLIHVPFFTNKVLREGETNSNLQYRVDKEYEGLPVEWMVRATPMNMYDQDIKIYLPGLDSRWSLWVDDLTEEQMSTFRQRYIEQNRTKDIDGVDRGIAGMSQEQKDKRMLDDIEFSVDKSKGELDECRDARLVHPLAISLLLSGARAVRPYNAYYQSV